VHQPPADATTQLRTAKLRVTAPRLAVLDALGAHPHADVDTLAEVARARLGSVSTQAVYDILRVLTDAGLVRRIGSDGSPARYELRIGDAHQHLVCRSCGRTEDVDDVLMAHPRLRPDETHGFVVDETELIFWGFCADCARQSRPVSQRFRS
jgi:Fur family ferric uptake transcriptional regulator